MRIAWDEIGRHYYETGVKQGVLYRQVNGAYPLGVPWNGLSAVTESPSGAEPNEVYADDSIWLNIPSAEKFAATIEAYTYPDEFAECDGSAVLATGVIITQQTRKPFGFSYRTALGNDSDGIDYGYKIHVVYGGQAAPTEKANNTVNESPEAITMSWEISTTPVLVTGHKPTAHLIFDSTKVDSAKLAEIEDILYGTASTDARLPLPDEIASILTGSGPSALALSSIVPADDAAAVVKSANIVLTFNNKILREAIVMMTAAGVLVPVVKTWDTAGKILTMNPSSDMAGTTVHIVSISGIVDIYGQSLDAVVKNFTTAA